MSYLTENEKRLLFVAIKKEKQDCERLDSINQGNESYKKLTPIIESLERKFQNDRFEKEIRAQAVLETIQQFSERMLELCESITVMPSIINQVSEDIRMDFGLRDDGQPEYEEKEER